MENTGKGCMDNTKLGKERQNCLPKQKRRAIRLKAHINTRKLTCNVLTIIDAFLDQKRVNVCEHSKDGAT